MPDESQQWDPDQYATNARFVAELGMPVVDLLAPRAGERILDLGCGDGHLTRKLADMGCDVIGVDSSGRMIETAKALGLDARVVDGEALKFDAEFDAVFSNAALHWMTHPDAVIDGVWRALRPGGRFVGEFGGAGNTAAVSAALAAALGRRGLDFGALSPWYFPTVEAYRAKLEARGFAVTSIALIPRPTPQPGPLTAWLETFGGAFLAALPESDRHPFLLEVQEACRAELLDADGRWFVDYVRLRFAASKLG